MFIPTSLTVAPGLKAELDVWKAITRAFDEQSAIVYPSLSKDFIKWCRTARD